VIDEMKKYCFHCRLFFVGSREGHMPEMLCYVQVNRLTPAPAVIFMVLSTLIFTHANIKTSILFLTVRLTEAEQNE